MTYKKQTLQYFTVLYETFVMTYYDADSGVIDVEEVRKNGQEDTHMKGTMYRDDDTGVWSWEDGEGETLFAEYSGQDLEDAILAYVQEHGCPVDASYLLIVNELNDNHTSVRCLGVFDTEDAAINAKKKYMDTFNSADAPLKESNVFIEKVETNKTTNVLLSVLS